MNSEILKTLRSKETENATLSWFEFLKTLFLISVIIILICLNGVLFISVAMSIILGLLLIRLFSLYHDYNHGAILKNSFLANIIMSFVGIFLLSPIPIWNRYHNFHHQNNTKPINIVFGSFPTISVNEYLELNIFEKNKYHIIRSPFTIIFSYMAVFLISFCINPFLNNPRENWLGCVSILIHFSIYLSLGVYDRYLLLFIIVIPFFILGLIGGLIFYLQHNSPDNNL